MATKRKHSTIPASGKYIRYDNGDYAAYLNGEIIGFYGSYDEAETELDRLHSAQLAH